MQLPRPHHRRIWLVAPLLGALSACAAQSLPGLAGDPQAPPIPQPEVPIQGSGDGTIVEYHAMCADCTVQFSTPDGFGTEDEVRGTFRRRVQFTATAGVGVVSMTITPRTGRVQRARIRVNSRVAAEVGAQPPGEVTTLTAAVR